MLEKYHFFIELGLNLKVRKDPDFGHPGSKLLQQSNKCGTFKKPHFGQIFEKPIGTIHYLDDLLPRPLDPCPVCIVKKRFH